MLLRLLHRCKSVAAVATPCALSLCLLPGAPTGAAAASESTHLSFFQRNRDFVLRAFERLPRETDSAAREGRAWDFDPFAEWDATSQVNHVRAALDTAAAPRDLEAFRLALGGLLDESEFAAARLDELDRLFLAHLRTALEVTLECPRDTEVQRVEAWLDGEHVADLTLSATERAALIAGGVLEVLRRVVEPRTQDLELRVWLAGGHEPATLVHAVEPVPDALRRVHLRVAAGQPLVEVVHVDPSTLGGSR